MPFDLDTSRSGYRPGLTSQMTENHWPSLSAVLELSHGFCRRELFSLSVGCWGIPVVHDIHCAAFVREHVRTAYSRPPEGSFSLPGSEWTGKVHRNLRKEKHRLGLESLKKLLFRSRLGRWTIGCGNGDTLVHRGCRLCSFIRGCKALLCCTMPDAVPYCMSSIWWTGLAMQEDMDCHSV